MWRWMSKLAKVNLSVRSIKFGSRSRTQSLLAMLTGNRLKTSAEPGQHAAQGDDVSCLQLQASGQTEWTGLTCPP